MGNLCGTPGDTNTPPGPPPTKPNLSRTPQNLKVYTLTELKKATKNFRADGMVGEGGFGRVFKGWVDEVTCQPSKVGVGIPVAVKISELHSLNHPHRWKDEMEFLGKFSHPNVVKLIGYCCEQKQFLLVYEYEFMQKGSLDEHLFRTCSLTFLHTSNNVIYHNIKTSSILSDGNFNPKLSDFGLVVTMGPFNGNTHVSTDVDGSYGYLAPEYIATGHLYTKSDVYGFGVVLLELLTGLRAVDRNRPPESQNLVRWAQPSLSSKKKIKKLIDPRLGDDYQPKGAWATVKLILKCLQSEPGKRPSMEEVLVVLQKVGSLKDRPK
ncbi:unnamed protein product [Citrullus colocynthis]|uniref:Protein kinase domain-containing protein n=1 Tax=Citrullus colocynthis TaxID=252529 RepID=A0ABP0Y2U0_9ROSI